MCNNKCIKQCASIFIFFFICVIPFFSQAPELKNVMPNSWEYVTRLEENEEKEFIRDNQEVIDSVENVIWHDIYMVQEGGGSVEAVITLEKIYQEKIGSEIFFRLLYTPKIGHDFDEWCGFFLQVLVGKINGKQELIAIGAYNKFIGGEPSVLAYNSIDIIRSNNRAKGILISNVSVPCESNTAVYIDPVKGQFAGIGEAHYILMEDLIKADFTKRFSSFSGGYFPDIYNTISMTPSDCLIDPKSPLRYGLQSAFDGNPATSYVENTVDDLMKIEFAYLEDPYKIAIINGYATTRQLYEANNRIKSIWTTTGVINLTDSCLKYQIIEISSYWSLYAEKIYKGLRYNDTCLAELNMKTENYGWLFGEINE